MGEEGWSEVEKKYEIFGLWNNKTFMCVRV
jgi:hypothetical protein